MKTSSWTKLNKGKYDWLYFHEGVFDFALFEKFIAEISESYFVKLSMNFPNEGTVKMTNNRGFSLDEIPGSTVISSGKKVSCLLPLNSVLSASDGINIEFLW